jgi:antitoxin MazE
MDILRIREEVITRLSRWGNTLAIGLPVAVVQVLNLREGDEIEVVVPMRGSFTSGGNPAPRRSLSG